jgi:3',5'-cyclic AMP phosphodiesterase CpdA
VTRIAHISDTHFGTEELPVCEALRSDLLRQGPDLVVLTGDITQRARSSQFRAARDFLDGLAPIPVLALPGNHDLPLFDLLTRFTAPYRLYRRHIGPNLSPAWQNSLAAVVGVNSTRILRHKNGELSPALIREVAKRLAALPQAFKIVALHHPLAIVEPADIPNRARGAEEALAAWTGAGADLFLGGHIHLPYCIPAGAASRKAVVLQAGTALSWRRRGRQANSYNLIRFDVRGERRMAIEQRDYDRASGSFGTRAAWEAAAGEGGWSIAPAGTN